MFTSSHEFIELASGKRSIRGSGVSKKRDAVSNSGWADWGRLRNTSSLKCTGWPSAAALMCSPPFFFYLDCLLFHSSFSLCCCVWLFLSFSNHCHSRLFGVVFLFHSILSSFLFIWVIVLPFSISVLLSRATLFFFCSSFSAFLSFTHSQCLCLSFSLFCLSMYVSSSSTSEFFMYLPFLAFTIPNAFLTIYNHFHSLPPFSSVESFGEHKYF